MLLWVGGKNEMSQLNLQEQSNKDHGDSGGGDDRKCNRAASWKARRQDPIRIRIQQPVGHCFWNSPSKVLQSKWKDSVSSVFSFFFKRDSISLWRQTNHCFIESVLGI